MNWQDIFNHLTHSERQEMICLMLRRIHLPHRMRLRNLRPINLLLPAVLAQIAFFTIVMLKPAENFFSVLALGNLVITSLVILPGIWSHPAPRAHWVR